MARGKTPPKVRDVFISSPTVAPSVSNALRVVPRAPTDIWVPPRLASKAMSVTIPWCRFSKPGYRRPRGLLVRAEIRKYQNSSNLLIQEPKFKKLVKEIARNSSLRFSPKSIKTLQTASEQFVVDMLKNANDHAEYMKRITIKKEDLQFAVKSHEQNRKTRH